MQTGSDSGSDEVIIYNRTLRSITNQYTHPQPCWDIRLSRLNHRFNGIRGVKNSVDYIILRDSGDSVTLPPEPDPTNPNISKRSFEREMQIWRQSLSALRHRHNHSPIPTQRRSRHEEWEQIK